MQFDRSSVSATGRPVLLPGEVEHGLTEKVDCRVLKAGSKNVTQEFTNGRALVTTQRLLWVHDTEPQKLSWSVPLCAIGDLEYKGSILRSTPKIKMRVSCNLSGRPEAPTGSPLLLSEVSMYCRGSKVEVFYERLQECCRKARSSAPGISGRVSHNTVPSSAAGPLGAGMAGGGGSSSSNEDVERLKGMMLDQLKDMGFNQYRAQRAVEAVAPQGLDAAMEWLLQHENDPLLDLPPMSADYETSMKPMGDAPGGPSTRAPLIGVSGILMREQQRAQQTDRSLEQAFHDLSALMDKAGEMVRLAQQFRAQLKGQEQDDKADYNALEDDLITMGIASPVTRDVAGASYHQELARQLADFLKDPVERGGGMMTLQDVYCLFNRARGTELVSPDDLLSAVSLFPRVGATLRLHTFPSGLKVVQSQTFSSQQVCQQIQGLLSTSCATDLGTALTSTDIAASINIPVTIATEWLLTAEGSGVLCRDDGPEGLRFFRNFFTQAVEGHG